MCEKTQPPNGLAPHRGGRPKEEMKRPASSRSKETFKGASQFNMLARREPRCDGEGRGLRGAVVEGTDECNDPNEHDGAEAVHRLVRKVDQVSTLPQLLRCVGSLSHWRGHRRVFLDRG